MFWFVVAITFLLGNVLLQVADVWTTVEALQAGALERNAFTRTLMERYGIQAWVILKGVIITMLIASIAFVRKADQVAQKQIAIPSSALLLWMTGVVVNNLIVLAAT